MKTLLNVVAVLGGVFVLFMTIGVFIAGWDRPPLETAQLGYRGTGMEAVVNPRTAEKAAAQNQAPEADPPAPAGGGPPGKPTRMCRSSAI